MMGVSPCNHPESRLRHKIQQLDQRGFWILEISGLFILQGVQHAESFVSQVPALLDDLGIVVQRERPISDLTAFVLSEPGQFSQNVCKTHSTNVKLDGRFRRPLGERRAQTEELLDERIDTRCK